MLGDRYGQTETAYARLGGKDSRAIMDPASDFAAKSRSWMVRPVTFVTSRVRAAFDHLDLDVPRIGNLQSIDLDPEAVATRACVG